MGMKKDFCHQTGVRIVGGRRGAVRSCLISRLRTGRESALYHQFSGHYAAADTHAYEVESIGEGVDR